MYTYKIQENFTLESGEILEKLEIAYQIKGNPNSRNTIWVNHALTGSQDFTSWWPGLFGENNVFDLKNNLVICANIIGSCYGTTGPLSISPKNNKPYLYNFPKITIRDIVKAHILLRKHLNINKINYLIGASLGGFQSIEWAIIEPDIIENLIPIACNSAFSPWGIAFNHSQRMAIKLDPSWGENSINAGFNGLKTARAIALLSYRNYKSFCKQQYDEDINKISNFKVCSYLDYQGDKIINRFNAFSYYLLSETMDSHNLGRNRENIENVLKKIKSKTLLIGIDTDILFPISEIEFMNNNIPNSKIEIINSIYGHDAFLIEYEQLNNIIKNFINN